MKLGFLRHSLMISRTHFMLEMACRNAAAGVSHVAWRQGAELRGHKADVPEMNSRRIEGSNEYVWEEHDNKLQTVPVEPDGLFSLHSQTAEHLISATKRTEAQCRPPTC